GEDRYRALGVRDLFQADHPPANPIALPAAAHVEAERRVAELGEELGACDAAAAVLAAAESMQDQERGPPLGRLARVRQVQDARELQTAGDERDPLFHDVLLCVTR